MASGSSTTRGAIIFRTAAEVVQLIEHLLRQRAIVNLDPDLREETEFLLELIPPKGVKKHSTTVVVHQSTDHGAVLGVPREYAAELILLRRLQGFAGRQPSATPAADIMENRLFIKKLQPGEMPSQIEWSAGAEEPAVAAEAPTVAAEAPTVAAEEPAVAVDAPTVAAEEPAVAAEAPTVAAEEPAVAVEAPTVAAEEPAVAAEEPTVAAEEPTVAAEEPAVAAEEPATEPESRERGRRREKRGRAPGEKKKPSMQGTIRLLEDPTELYFPGDWKKFSDVPAKGLSTVNLLAYLADQPKAGILQVVTAEAKYNFYMDGGQIVAMKEKALVKTEKRRAVPGARTKMLDDVLRLKDAAFNYTEYNRLPIRQSGGGVSLMKYMTAYLTKLLKPMYHSDLEGLLDPLWGFYVSVPEEMTYMVEALKVSGKEKHILEHVLTGENTLKMCYARSVLGDSGMSRFIVRFGLLGLLEFTGAPVFTSTSRAPEDILKDVLSKMNRQNAFEHLHVHWSAHETEITKAFETQRKAYGVDSKIRKASSECNQIAESIWDQVEESYKKLRTAQSRSNIRDESYGPMKQKAAASLIHKQAHLAVIRGQFELAILLFENAVDLHRYPEYERDLAKYRGGKRS